jgi:arginyl-tRNA synthetase
MNRYYEVTPVATGDVTELQKEARLGVIAKVSQVFVHGLDVLGIEVPSQM